MKPKRLLPIQRLLGKIDNDFNISESDWIPRVAAWTIDALAQLKVLPMDKKTRTLEVKDRIAQFPCMLNCTDLKVCDSNGCEIPLAGNSSCCSNSSNNKNERSYVLDCDQIHLNFDTDEIIVESYEVLTYYDEQYDCDVPYIYDNGLLLEALAWYIMFKYLSRGSKHQVYSLTARDPYTNPAARWEALKYKAAASVRKDISIDKGWRNFFYNATFMPRG